LAKEFQNAAVEVLVVKTLKAVEKHKPKTLIVAGGVAANKRLKKELTRALNAKRHDLKTFFLLRKFPNDLLLCSKHFLFPIILPLINFLFRVIVG